MNDHAELLAEAEELIRFYIDHDTDDDLLDVVLGLAEALRATIADRDDYRQALIDQSALADRYFRLISRGGVEVDQ